MPRDLRTRNDAQAELNRVPCLWPANSLCEAILKDADRNIARVMREGQALEAKVEKG